MTNLQALGNRINALIARRDAGENTQTEIDALMIQLEVQPEAATLRQQQADETSRAYASI